MGQWIVSKMKSPSSRSLLSLLRIVMSSLVFLMLSTGTTVALPADTPESVVSKFIALVQKQRDYDRAADYIDWNSSYRRFSRQQQVLFALLQITSAQRLREVSLIAIKDPRNFVSNMTSELTQGFSFLAHSDELLSSQLQPLVDPYLNEIVRARTRIEKLSFGPPQGIVNGTLANVRMQASEQNRRSTVTVPLVSIQNRWLINPLDVVVSDQPLTQGSDERPGIH